MRPYTTAARHIDFPAHWAAAYYWCLRNPGQLLLIAQVEHQCLAGDHLDADRLESLIGNEVGQPVRAAGRERDPDFLLTVAYDANHQIFRGFAGCGIAYHALVYRRRGGESVAAMRS